MNKGAEVSTAKAYIPRRATGLHVSSLCFSAARHKQRSNASQHYTGSRFKFAELEMSTLIFFLMKACTDDVGDFSQSSWPHSC
jgi:hypothetical protein